MGTSTPKPPTALARARAETAQAREQLAITEIAALLALTSAPDYQERINEEFGTYYTVKAYGLHRADGGYVTITFTAPGQRDTIRFYRFDGWRTQCPTLFAVVAANILHEQYRRIQAVHS